MIPRPDQITSDPEAEAIRRLLDARLAEPLTDEEYRFLEFQGALAEIGAAPIEGRGRSQAIRKALRLVADHRRAEGKVVEETPKQTGGMATDDRDRRYALSRLLALEAERGQEVQGFIQRHLHGERLEWASMEEWIRKNAPAQGEHSQYVEVVLPPGAPRFTASGTAVESPVPLKDVQTEGGVRAKLLRYGVPGSGRVKVVAVKAGGVLDELRKLSEKLAHEYRWTVDQATVFVLTGITPLMVGIRVETEIQDEHPAASKIRLEIDPVVAPVEVLGAYSSLRQKVLEGTYRPLRDKHLSLAVFAAERRPPAKWAQVMAAWNDMYPDEEYLEETVFARDCTAAQRRLLRPRLDPDALL